VPWHDPSLKGYESFKIIPEIKRSELLLAFPAKGPILPIDI
jgi:hypothetical protein